MRTIQYIFFCIVSILDAWVGKGANVSIKDAIVGFSAMLIVIALFFISLRFFDNKTTFSSPINILCSIVVAMSVVCITIVVIIVIEKIFF